MEQIVSCHDSPTHGGLPDPSEDDWAVGLLDAMGTRQFGTALADFLGRVFPGAQYAAFQFHQDVLIPFVSSDEQLSWLPAGWLQETKRRLAEHDSRYAKIEVISPPLILMHARRNGLSYAIGIGRGAGMEFAPWGLRRLSDRADLLIGVLAKHAELTSAHSGAVLALSSLSEIERCLAQCGSLTTREAEVCARILYGVSTLGISLDLNVGEGTVKTYRKRAYRRLSLSSERELVTWYLKRWAEWKGIVIRHFRRN